MSELELDKSGYLEFEKLALGAFSPLGGFMNEDEFRGVVDNMRLPDGSPFTLPVALDLSTEVAERIRGLPRVTLVYGGEEVGTLAPDSFFTCDRTSTAEKLFGTADSSHPGVKRFCTAGDVFVGGPVDLKKRISFEFSDHELTPSRTREIFAERGWNTVVGFQTRNVPHRAHEYLQRVGLEIADGLFVQPLVGWKKRGDYTPEAIISGYQKLISDFYPKNSVVFGILSTSMRYAGPREAVFHAIIRRNYGCTHFIVGRDHAGVGDYYGLYDAHDLTRRFDGELGIEILRLHGPYYCRICDGIATHRSCPHETTDPDAVHHISGTDMRAILTGGREPERHLMRPEIVAALDGVELFVTEDEE